MEQLGDEDRAYVIGVLEALVEGTELPAAPTKVGWQAAQGPGARVHRQVPCLKA